MHSLPAAKIMNAKAPSRIRYVSDILRAITLSMPDFPCANKKAILILLKTVDMIWMISMRSLVSVLGIKMINILESVRAYHAQN